MDRRAGPGDQGPARRPVPRDRPDLHKGSPAPDREPEAAFEWRVTDPDNPGASWRFDLAEQGTGSRVRFSMIIGQENNGTVPRALKDRDHEERVLNERRRTLKANMQATVDGVRALVDDKSDTVD